jgi:hypothetical protein
MEQQWYIARNKQKIGPYSIEQMLALITDGQLLKSDMVLESSQKKWRLAETVEEMFSPSKDNNRVNITPEPSITLSIPFSNKQPNEQWFIARNKQKIGPFSTAQMQQKATIGELLRNEMVLDSNQKKWCLAETVEDIFPSVKKDVAPTQPLLLTLESPSFLSRYLVLIGALIVLVLLGCGFFFSLNKQKPNVSGDTELVIAEKSEEPKSPVVKQEQSALKEEPAKPEEPKKTVVKQESISPKKESPKPEEPKKTVVKQESISPKKESPKPEEPKKTVVKQEQKERLINDDKIKSIIDQLLGDPLEHYKDFGFKDVKLGADYSELKNSHNVVFKHSVFTNAVFLDDMSLAANRYIFNGTDKLVCYTKVLKGNINDYADRIVEIFGKTNQEIEDKAIKYTFEKTLVYITPQSVGTMSDLQYLTVIKIWDKEWVKEVLFEYAANVSELLEWQKETTALIRNKDFDVNTVLKLPETIIEPAGDLEKRTFRLVYPKNSEEKITYLGIFGYMIPPDYVTSGGNEKFKKIPIVSVKTAIRLKSTPRNPLYELKKWEDKSFRTPVPTNDFAALTATNYVNELSLFLLQSYYPPKTSKIEVITTKYGVKIRQWKTKDGWHVQVNKNEVILSFLGVDDDL